MGVLAQPTTLTAKGVTNQRNSTFPHRKPSPMAIPPAMSPNNRPRYSNAEDGVNAQRELRRRELTLFATRSKIRPMLGRLQVDAHFDITGELGVTGTVPAPSYDEVILLAEQSRPDILSDMRDIQRAQAAVRLEERKAYPIVNFQPGLSYQQTKFITGLPSQRFLDFYLSSTLPTTDRNQGGIAKAQSDLRNRFMTLQADLTDLRAEVEQAVETYRVALATITADDPATLKAAKDVRDKTEEAWKAGGLKLLDLLDAQRAYRDRVRASISSQADYWRALNRLNAAIGIRAVGEELPPKDKEPAQPPKK